MFAKHLFSDVHRTLSPWSKVLLLRVLITFLVYSAHGPFGLTSLQDIWVEALMEIWLNVFTKEIWLQVLVAKQWLRTIGDVAVDFL
jgi:hypothetical protein